MLSFTRVENMSRCECKDHVVIYMCCMRNMSRCECKDHVVIYMCCVENMNRCECKDQARENQTQVIL